MIVKNESSVEFDLHTLLNGSDENMEMVKMCYQSESYKKALTAWLPFLDDRGFLDSMF